MRKSARVRVLPGHMISGLFLALAFVQGCSHEQAPPPEHVNPVLQNRRDRDAAFKTSPQSPIPAQDRARFQGLSYFPFNPALQFRLKLNRYPIPARIRMATNTGEIRDGLRYGYFEFDTEEQRCRLQVYRLDDGGDSGKASLFIPFKDSTSGKETYGAGRYIDLAENTSGIYDLDFNQAYNPYCAYGEEYSCPIPPEENRLAIPIRAGEKIYALARQ
jgi:uncharacterized protein (DUF1684 family)